MQTPPERSGGVFLWPPTPATVILGLVPRTYCRQRQAAGSKTRMRQQMLGTKPSMTTTTKAHKRGLFRCATISCADGFVEPFVHGKKLWRRSLGNHLHHIEHFPHVLVISIVVSNSLPNAEIRLLV